MVSHTLPRARLGGRPMSFPQRRREPESRGQRREVPAGPKGPAPRTRERRHLRPGSAASSAGRRRAARLPRYGAGRAQEPRAARSAPPASAPRVALAPGSQRRRVRVGHSLTGCFILQFLQKLPQILHHLVLG